jgi:hypothetical protein
MTGLTCVAFRRVVQNTLRGFADLRLDEVGLVLCECPVHLSGNRPWVGLPGRAQIGADGRTLTDARGKMRYTPIVRSAGWDAFHGFSKAAVQAVLTLDPNAFDPE